MKQTYQKADSWLPRAHEDEGRPSRTEEKTPAWQKEAFGIIRCEVYEVTTVTFSFSFKRRGAWHCCSL